MVDKKDLKSFGGNPTVRVRVPPSAPRGVAQLVERAVWDREVVSSNLATPTDEKRVGDFI